jgi:hypothetical protein
MVKVLLAENRKGNRKGKQEILKPSKRKRGHRTCNKVQRGKRIYIYIHIRCGRRKKRNEEHVEDSVQGAHVLHNR